MLQFIFIYLLYFSEMALMIIWKFIAYSREIHWNLNIALTLKLCSNLHFLHLNLIFFKMIFSIFDCVFISNWKWCLNCSTCKLLSFQFWESLSYPCICKFSIFIENNAKMLHKFILWFTFYRAKEENGDTLNQQMVEVSNLEFLGEPQYLLNFQTLK